MTEPSVTDSEIRAMLNPLRSGKPKVKAVPAKEKKRTKKAVPHKDKTPWGWKVGDREICDDSSAGISEYGRRIIEMAARQGGRCKCGAWFTQTRPTFGHDIPRGNGGMNRDDRIWDAEGKPMNHAECWDCNGAKGSKRI